MKGDTYPKLSLPEHASLSVFFSRTDTAYNLANERFHLSWSIGIILVNKSSPGNSLNESLSIMSFVIVDVESDGPIPAEFSMVCFGAVLFDENLNTTFYGKTRPISERFVPEALAVSGFSREDHLNFEDPKSVMESFSSWLDQHSDGRPVFVSDNLAFDWQFINFYFHRFLGRNPFGFSGRRIGDLYAGLVKNAYKATDWKKYRVTRHTHNPVDDARGNAEALKKFRDLGLKI